MRLDLDTYKEILDTITRNKSRSLLTGFGVFWGVFMLIALMGGGQGLKEMLQNNFTGFATNTAIIWAQNTTKPYKGFNKGRSWQMEEKDLERLRHRVPELDVITPLLFGGNKSVVFGDKKFSGSTQGVNPDYAQVSAPKMFYGRYINEMDVRRQRKVCVIGKQIYKTLFPGGGDPCGKSVRVDSTYYYRPYDAAWYNYYSTDKGILEKEDPTSDEFWVQPEILDLVRSRDFGPYANEKGELQLCFLSNNDITGGNSGSPVFDKNARLIGLAFDGNWEAMSGDIAFEPDLQRCIGVDIRYVLFMIDKWGKCPRLIEELKLVR